jgi:hypothetical protein
MGALKYTKTKETRKYMQKKKTFSTMELILLGVVIGSLLLSFLQSWREERTEKKRT